ncbi:MAG: cyclodeaminase/cyclohydrolase family protein [Gaiellaceae bacterium]
MRRLADLSFTALLEELGAPRETPGAGSALAAALAAGAATVQMAARLSRDSWPEGAGVAAQAESLRERAVHLVEEDAEVYERALEARADLVDDKQERRDWTLGQAVAAAAEPPLALARLAADLAELCREAADRIEPRVHADLAAAAALAAGVALGARSLVAVNLTALPDDPRVAEADRLAAAAADAAAAIGAGP